MFRMNSSEIAELGKIREREQFEEYVKNKSAQELRWQVIEKRFINFEDDNG